MANSGIFLHLVVMLVVAAVAYLSIVTIARAAERYHFSDLIVLALGRNWGIVIDFIIIIYLYGTVIRY